MIALKSLIKIKENLIKDKIVAVLTWDVVVL